jgi:hypothetical protein
MLTEAELADLRMECLQLAHDRNMAGVNVALRARAYLAFATTGDFTVPTPEDPSEFELAVRRFEETCEAEREEQRAARRRQLAMAS